MTVSCFPRNEEQIRRVVKSLREAGLFDQYEEQAHGEHILLTVHTQSVEEREQVKEIFEEAGIFELIYGEGSAA